MLFVKKNIICSLTICSLASLLSNCSPNAENDETAGVHQFPPLTEETKPLPPERCDEDPTAYNRTAVDYEKEFNLPLNWSEWMINHYERFCLPFEKGNFYNENYDGRITLSLFYYNDTPVPYVEAWPEEEHEIDIERFLELSFPGFDFEAKFYRNQKTSDVIVYLNSPKSYISGRNVYLHYESIISHEIGHFLGLKHHYDDINEIGQGRNMPPGEEKCIFDRNDTQYGSSDRFALNLDLDVDNYAQIDALIKKINRKYPFDY